MAITESLKHPILTTVTDMRGFFIVPTPASSILSRLT